MKPMSIIFLIVSVVLIIGGVCLCLTAQNMSNRDNVNIFNTEIDSETGNSKYIEEINDEEIGKFVVLAENVDVNIYGGAEHSYVEIINFPYGSYGISTSGKTVTFNSTLDFSDFSIILSRISQFNGLRNYINIKQYQNHPKVLNLYLSDNTTLNRIDVSIQSGNIQVQQYSAKCDFYLSTEEGNISFVDVTTTSTIDIKNANGNVTLNNIQASIFDLEIQNGNLYTENLFFQEVTCEIETGNAEINTTTSTDRIKWILEASSGSIYINSLKHNDNKYENTPDAFSESYTIKINSGNINING